MFTENLKFVFLLADSKNSEWSFHIRNSRDNFFYYTLFVFAVESNAKLSFVKLKVLIY